MKREIVTILFMIGSVQQIMACSGPGAGKAIRTSIEIGNYCALISVVLTLFIVWINRKYQTKTKKALLSASILLTIFHPGFWVGATSGDCGVLRIYSSIIITSLILLILLFTLYKRNKKKAGKYD